MIMFDEIDNRILKENFTEELIKRANYDNVSKIFKYLDENGVYYANDLFLNSLDLFLYPAEIFIKKFEHLKMVLGTQFVDKLGEDAALIEIMYEV